MRSSPSAVGRKSGAGTGDGASGYVMQSFMGAVNRMKLFRAWSGGSVTVVSLGKGELSFDDVLAVARGGAQVELGPAALDALARGRALVDELAAAPTPAYGIS